MLFLGVGLLLWQRVEFPWFGWEGSGDVVRNVIETPYTLSVIWFEHCFVGDTGILGVSRSVYVCMCCVDLRPTYESEPRLDFCILLCVQSLLTVESTAVVLPLAGTSSS